MHCLQTRILERDACALGYVAAACTQYTCSKVTLFLGGGTWVREARVTLLLIKL
uniref:Uncharacterized protein n=1 Tax=Anguilla anguilla TaxID=7936 RepID=A0A0E9T5Y6_ANGAN